MGGLGYPTPGRCYFFLHLFYLPPGVKTLTLLLSLHNLFLSAVSLSVLTLPSNYCSVTDSRIAVTSISSSMLLEDQNPYQVYCKVVLHMEFALVCNGAYIRQGIHSKHTNTVKGIHIKRGSNKAIITTI